MRIRRSFLAAALGLVLAACGRGASDEEETASGGSPGSRDGGAGGSRDAGPGAGGGGAGGSSDPDPAFPPRPPWQPGSPVGTPGWKDSTETFCSDLVGRQTAQVWSAPGQVYVLVFNGCGADNASFCNQMGRKSGRASTLYVNEGSGFRLLHRESPRAVGTRLVNGFPDGRVVFGTERCYATVLEEGEPRCLIAEQDDYASELRTVGDDTVIVLTGSSGSRPSGALLAHDGSAEMRLGGWTPSPLFVAANRERILIGNYPNAPALMDPVPDAPLRVVEGSPTSLQVSGWLFDDGDFALFGYSGALTLYRDGAFETIETGFSGEGVQLWGAPDKTLFVITPTAFARVEPGGSLETILSRDAASAEPGWKITGIWGNGSSEVFLSIDDPAYEQNACGTTVLAWFDGTELHQL